MNEHLILDLNKQRIKVNVNRPTITRQGEVDAQTLNVQITLDGAPYDLTGCTVFFEALRGDGKKIIEEASITNALSGYISITLPAGLSLQHGHAQLAYFAVYNADDSIITTESMEIVTLPGLCMFTDSDYIPYIERIIKELEAYLENVSEMEAAVTQIAEQAAQQVSSVNQALAASSVATSDAEAATALAVEAVEDLDAIKTELNQVKTDTEQAATSATTAATAANTAATAATTAAAAANSAAEDAQDTIEALQSADPFVEASVYINSSGTNKVVFENATDELGEKLGIVGKLFKLTIDGFFDSVDKIESIHFESTTYTKDIPIGMFDDSGVFKPGLKLSGYLNKGCFQVINPHDAASRTVLVPLFDIASSSSGGVLELTVGGSVVAGGDGYNVWDSTPTVDQTVENDELAFGSVISLSFYASDNVADVYFDSSHSSIRYGNASNSFYIVPIAPATTESSSLTEKLKINFNTTYLFVVAKDKDGYKCLIPLWDWKESGLQKTVTINEQQAVYVSSRSEYSLQIFDSIDVNVGDYIEIPTKQLSSNDIHSDTPTRFIFYNLKVNGETLDPNYIYMRNQNTTIIDINANKYGQSFELLNVKIVGLSVIAQSAYACFKVTDFFYDPFSRPNCILQPIYAYSRS